MVLPFKQDDIYLGLAEINGLLRIADKSLEIEYKVKDVALGMMDSGIKTCRIPLRIIDTIKIEKKWFTGKLEITFTRIPDLDNPIRLENNRLILSVKKKDLEKAQAFRSKVMYEILQRKLGDMAEDEYEEKSHFPQQKKAGKKEAKSTIKTHQKPETGESAGGLKNMLRSE